ncbi:MAG: sigma-54 dependent transcriptional regulator [Planctomycetota bacterium]
MSTVLVVDDKQMMRDSVASTLQRAGFAVVTAHDGALALELAAKRRPDAIVTDLKMPNMTGVELLEKIRELDDDLPVVLMTAFGAIESAVDAMRLGAYDYITKPFQGDELVISVKRALAHARVLRENAVLKATTDRSAASPEGVSVPGSGIDRIIGASPAMRRVKEQVHAVASSHGNVLICGESGSGKEVVARAIHELSPRAAAPFLAVNCAALSESLLESELFGHERGAFTGAESLRKGRFELADSGSLLLDEVSEVPGQIQAKLLRVLQERAFERVGSSLTIGVDVRVIATSNRQLPRSVANGDFRQDLFFRLNVLPIHLPPLRDRVEDVPSLAAHFVREIAGREGRGEIAFDADALELLMQYPWPGNVRELQNICERAVVLSGMGDRVGKVGTGDARSIGRALIEPWLGSAAQGDASLLAGEVAQASASPAASGFAEVRAVVETPPAEDALFPEGEICPLEDLERRAIVEALRRFDGHRQKTARALGIGVRTLGLKLKKWKEQQLVEASL